MNNYQYINKIVIEATKERPIPPIVSRLVDDNSLWLDVPASMISKVEISDIHLSDWKVTMHTEYIERFKRVADIVGIEKAEEVLKALDS